MMKIAGVKMNETKFWKLVESIQTEVRDAVRLETQKVTDEMIELAAKRITERKLSLIAGKPIALSNKSWNYWRNIIVPSWFVRELR